jgi:hypothetical protein
VNVKNPFSPLTNEAIQLLKQFEDVKNKLNRYATNEEIYEICNFTPEQRLVVVATQVQMHNQAHIANDDCNDYTNFRRNIDREKETVACNFEITEALRSTKLTPLERRVVEASLQSVGNGWQTAVAKEMLNPSTNKPYSRAAIAGILERALNKIKQTYLKREVA